MKIRGVNIATARIKGLTKPIFYFEEQCYYAWSITFSDTSTLKFNQLPYIEMGETEEEGKIFCNQIKENFKNAHIYEGDKVAILFRNDEQVLAIGRLGEDTWIDVTDRFKVKNFKDLDVFVISLKVY